MNGWFYSGKSFHCEACAAYANVATGSLATGANGVAFNAALAFVSYTAQCTWLWGAGPSLLLTRDGFTGAWTFNAKDAGAVSCYALTVASAIIDCSSGTLAGVYDLPATGNDPACTGTLRITLL